MNKIQNYFSSEDILSYALGFVTIWFGIGEIFFPQNWVAFVPNFLGVGTLALIMVVVHGMVLTTSSSFLFLNYYRKIGIGIIILLLIEIIISLIFQSGFSDIVVRDIGLLGSAIALFMYIKK